MDTGAALLAAVRERPDDDTPRLAYADWLDDTAGELPNPEPARARAAFIRLQCELAAPPPSPPRRPSAVRSQAIWWIPVVGASLARQQINGYLSDLEAHATALAGRAVKEGQARHLATRFGHPSGPWIHDLLAADRGDGRSTTAADWDCLWSRGFIKELRLTAEDWLAHAGTALAAQRVRRVGRTTIPDLREDGPERNPEDVLFCGWKLDYPEAKTTVFLDHDGWAGLLLRLLRGDWPGIAFKLTGTGPAVERQIHAQVQTRPRVRWAEVLQRLREHHRQDSLPSTFDPPGNTVPEP